MVLAMVAVSMPFQARGETPALKIAYVDLKRVMLESEKGKEARKGLTDEFEKRKKEIAQKQGELQKIKDALEKGADMMTPEARSEKEKQYQTKLKNYQRIANDYQSEIQQKDQELTQKVLKELEEIIKGMGDQDRYTLILEKNHAGHPLRLTCHRYHRKGNCPIQPDGEEEARHPKEVLTGVAHSFGDSSWNLELRVWLSDLAHYYQIQSEINSAIVHKFREYGIEIPYPQRDLHVKEPSPFATRTGQGRAVNPDDAWGE